MLSVTPVACIQDTQKNMKDLENYLSLSCPKAAKIILFLQRTSSIFRRGNWGRRWLWRIWFYDVFSVRRYPRCSLCCFAGSVRFHWHCGYLYRTTNRKCYQNCIEEGRQFDIDDLLRECERHQKEGSLSEFISKHLSEKGADAASLHQWNRQKKELQVLRGLERLRPEWNQILDGAEKWLYREWRNL